MAYRYRKPYRIKRKKSILKNRFFGLGILFLAAAGGIAYFLFFSGIFQVEKIIITGDKIVSEDSIRPFVPLKNIFFIDIEEIKKDILEKFPPIAEVRIRRGFPDGLEILVIGRIAAAVWCETEKCFLIDIEGVNFGEAEKKTDLIKITGAKEFLGKEKIAQILEIRAKLKEGLGITTTQAFIASDERLNIETSEGWQIYFNLRGDLNWQLQELGLVLEKQIPSEKRKNLEYIDLRFSRVYYK